MSATFRAILAVLAALPLATYAGMAFQDASNQMSGFVNQTNGGDGFSGVVWFDYDRDGDEDLFFTGGLGYRNGLLRNDAGSFVDVTEAAGLGGASGGSGAVAVDVDNDGYQDLIVAIDGAWFSLLPSRIRVFRNLGDATFEDRSAASGLNAMPALAGQAQHLAAADIDNDGYVDLFVVAPGNRIAVTQPRNQLFRNDGDFSFTNVTAGSGVASNLGPCAAAFTDYNRDGWQDIVVADCHDITGALTPIELFVNDGDFTFTQRMGYAGLDTRTHTDPPAPGPRGFWMCMDLGDYDIFATNVGDGNNPTQEHGLFERQAGGKYVAVETGAGISAIAPEFGWGCGFADFDNDAWLDLAFVGSFPPLGFIGQGRANPGHLMRNNGDKTFASVPLPVDLSGRFTSGLGVADFNGDGLVDIAIGTGPWLLQPLAKPVLLRNTSTDAGHWLEIRLVGDGVTSNADAIGARVRVSAGGVSQEKEVRAGGSFLSQHSLVMHFGLGGADTAERVIVRWPSGGVTRLQNVAGNRVVTIAQEVTALERP